MNNVLTTDDLNHFKQYGYVLCKNVFPSSVAKECRDVLWKEMITSNGYDIDDPLTWIDSKFQMSHVYDKEEKPFDGIFTTKLYNIIDEICGKDNTDNFGAGWFTITFPQNQHEPWNIDGHFHIDGSGYIHYPYSKEIGLILLILLSDVHDNWGGTAIAEKSHIIGVQNLIEAGLRGISAEDLSLTLREQSDCCFDIIEAIGSAGDIIVMHPLMLHARSKNLAPIENAGVRFLCHPSVPLKRHMNFNKEYDDMTILEQSIVDAIKSSKQSESSSSYWLEILKTITPEACDNFRNNKRKVIEEGDNKNTKLVRFDDEDGMNPSRFDKNDVDLQNNQQYDILSTMGFFQFGNKR
jgi:hypothetical protein